MPRAGPRSLLTLLMERHGASERSSADDFAVVEIVSEHPLFVVVRGDCALRQQLKAGSEK